MSGERAIEKATAQTLIDRIPDARRKGIFHTARSVNSNTLETTAEKNAKDDPGLIIDELSADGTILIFEYATSPQQVLVFDRKQ